MQLELAASVVPNVIVATALDIVVAAAARDHNTAVDTAAADHTEPAAPADELLAVVTDCE